VRCHAFPVVVITSNGEREFSPAFLRRCLQLNIQPPNDAKLERIVEAHLGDDVPVGARSLIEHFVTNREHGDLATDQLLNAIYLATSGPRPDDDTRERLVERLLRPIDAPAGPV
ncbi:MAG TPA: MoxR family ATPase, partial [Micromonospora sp.]